MNNAKVSFVVPTFNSARTLSECLRSIREQNYPPDRMEIVIADAGSSDSTLSIAGEFKCDRIVQNDLRTGEAGKSAGIRAATGEFIALVDSDNILDSPDWLRTMMGPFTDPDITATEPLWYTRRDQDPPLTRYFAMLGMNDPLCLFLGNYDRRSLITDRWTGLDVPTEEHDSYLKLTLSSDNLPTIGANGFVCRRSLLDHIDWQPYFFDIDAVQQAVEAGYRHVAKVKCGIVHLYCRTLSDFARKQDRRVRDFLFFSADRTRTYPWKGQKRLGLVRFCIYTVLVVPLLCQMAKGWSRKTDPAWRLHIPVCWITLWVYGLAVIRKALGAKPRARTRDGWNQ
jgi:glycosyltransferase involved in cell wall biosynthesis